MQLINSLRDTLTLLKINFVTDVSETCINSKFLIKEKALPEYSSEKIYHLFQSKLNF